MATTPTVENLGDVLRALKTVERDVRLGVRRELRQAAEPVRGAAQTMALENIRRMPYSPRWAGMRVGVTRSLIYVAPRQRGVKTVARAPQRRGRQFADLLMERAMQPALDQHQTRVVADVRNVLDRAAARFNRS